MKKRLRYIVFAVLSLVVYSINAQDNTMFFLRGVPQNSSINASVIPSERAYIGLPFLSSMQLDYYNSGLTMSDILHKGSGQTADSMVIDYKGMANSMDANNVSFQEIANTWLGFGFKIKRSYISFALNSKIKTQLYYPGTIANWQNGNYDYNNDVALELTTQGTTFNALAYNEIVIGYAQPIGDKLSVGVRLKYIMGMANIVSDKFDITINTLSSSQLQLQTNIDIQTNLPLSVSLDSLGFVDTKNLSMDNNADIKKLMLDNKGFGFDCGATYQPIKRLTLGLALNDIGFITWENYPHKFTSKSFYTYEGVDLSNMLGEKDINSSGLWKIKDSIQNSFKVQTNTGSYQTGLQGNMIITGNFEMLKWLDLGAMVKTQFYQGRVYPSLGLACGMNPSTLFSSSVTYSLRKGSYFNLGLGMAFNPGPFQLYVATDNLPYAFSIQNANALNLRFGINIIIDSKKEKSLN